MPIICRTDITAAVVAKHRFAAMNPVVAASQYAVATPFAILATATLAAVGELFQHWPVILAACSATYSTAVRKRAVVTVATPVVANRRHEAAMLSVAANQRADVIPTTPTNHIACWTAFFVAATVAVITTVVPKQVAARRTVGATRLRLKTSNLGRCQIRSRMIPTCLRHFRRHVHDVVHLRLENTGHASKAPQRVAWKADRF